MNKFNYTKDKSNKMLLLLMVVILTITFFPKAVLARSTFDEAADEIENVLNITYYSTTGGRETALGSKSVDIQNVGFLQTEKTQVKTNVKEMAYEGVTIDGTHYDPNKIQKIVWEIGDTTFILSQQNKYSDNKKDGVLYVPSDHDLAAYKQDESKIIPILEKDPDYDDIPSYKSMKLAFAIRYVVKVALDTVFGWISNTMGTTFDGMIGFFQDSFGMSTDYFKAIITDGVFNTSVKLFKSVGFTLTILIYLLTLYAGFFGSLGNEDNPVENVPRALIAGF